MASVNNVVIAGNLARDAETKQFGDRTKISFAIATNEKRKDKEDRVDFHNCDYWVKSTGIVQYLLKGKPVAVVGKLRTDKFQDKDGGNKYRTYIDVRELQLLGGGNGAGAQKTSAPIQNGEYSDPEYGMGDEDQLPF
jgi:single-strand DNA-binding protein